MILLDNSAIKKYEEKRLTNRKLLWEEPSLYSAVQNASLRACGFPREYIQGRGALQELPSLMKPHGFGRAVAIVDPVMIDRLRPALAGMPIELLAFGGECTFEEAERLSQDLDDYDLVIGIGGGKSLDTAKMVSIIKQAGFFSVPTIASNDAPTSRLVVLYDKDHRIVGNRFMAFNPDVVLVDTDIIAGAPVRFLRAGIGDALTKFYEARAVQRSGGRNFLSASPPYVAMSLGAVCLDTILVEGASCLESLAKGERAEGFERLVEAAILLSGLAFESGGLSIAHSMARGLTRIPEIASALHGEQVAYGLLVQLQLEGDAAALQRLQAFCRSIGHPARLCDFGVKRRDVRAAIKTIADGTLTAPYLVNFGFAVTREHLLEAMASLEADGEESHCVGA